MCGGMSIPGRRKNESRCSEVAGYSPGLRSSEENSMAGTE